MRVRLRELAEIRRRFGSPRLHVLLRREGLVINHKRIERVYRKEKLSLRLNKRKTAEAFTRGIVGAIIHQRALECGFHERYAHERSLHQGFDYCGFVGSGQSGAGGKFFLAGATGGVCVLEHLRLQGRKLRLLRGWTTGLNSPARRWTLAYEYGVMLEFTRPGKPMDNGHIESFDGKVRDECLNQSAFGALADAKDSIERWGPDYNWERPQIEDNWRRHENYCVWW